jgi:protein TonB
VGNRLKLDIFSLGLSLIIHSLLLSVPLFKEAFSSKTYQIVNAVPISFDTEVESELVGVKSVKGNSKSGGSRKSSTISSGKRSAWQNQNLNSVKVKARRKGEVKRAVKEASVGKSGSYSLRRLTTGKGDRFISLSVDIPGDKNSKRLPSVSYNRLVPYLIKVRDKIMKNWTPPYYRSSNEKRKVIVSLKINRDGSIEEINIIKFSPDIAFNRSAVRAIYSSEPFEKFPEGVKVNQVRLKVNFEVR